jgi:hypothetical protein
MSQNYGFNSRFVLPFLIIVLLSCLTACNRKKAVEERQIDTTRLGSTAATAQSSNYPKLTAPTPEQVTEAVDRVFAGVVQVNRSEAPGYIVGDFNGDGSEDLAVWAKANPERIKDLNDELANWTIVDPQKTFVPPPGHRVVKLPPKPERDLIKDSEPLLIMIHGYEAQGWRDPNAKQAFVLHNVPGRSLTTAHVEKLPGTLHTAEVVFPQRDGFLYWLGGSYAWKKSRVAKF